MIVFGSRNPVAISQTKPGNLVRGMRKRVFGKTRFNQLSSPHTARKRPNTTNHFGKSFINADGMDTPAIKRPNGTENPGPAKNILKVVQRLHEGGILRNAWA